MKKTVIIDTRMRDIEKQKIKELGYEIIEIKPSKNVYQEISSHVDIFACKVNNQIIVSPEQYINMPKTEIFIKGESKLEEKYPYDIKYNVCTIGNIAIHNFKYTDNIVKKELLKQRYKLVNTKQGYTNCSIAVINENTVITADKGLYKILKENAINTLLIDNNKNIKLLDKQGYSNKQGFIGGCISKLGNNIIVFGDLDKIDIDKNIRNFIENNGLKIIEFKGLDVIDYGGIVEI